MNDTSPQVRALYRRLLMERSGQERMRMASDMWVTARQLQRARFEAERDALQHADPAGENGDTEDLRVHLLKSTYGDELDATTIRRVAERARRVR